MRELKKKKKPSGEKGPASSNESNLSLHINNGNGTLHQAASSPGVNCMLPSIGEYRTNPKHSTSLHHLSFPS